VTVYVGEGMEMNSETAVVIAEVIGAVAVVISVVYLAAQIHRQTEQSRLAATREIAAQWNDILNHVIEDEAFADLYLRGVQDYESLPNRERLRVSFIFQRIMRLLEQQILHIEKGHLELVIFDSMNRAIYEWLTFPGTQKWWEMSKELFEEGFQTKVDKLIAEAKSKGYDSSFKREGVNPPIKSLNTAGDA